MSHVVTMGVVIVILVILVFVCLMEQNVVIAMIAPTFSFAMVDSNGISQYHTFHHYNYDIARAVNWVLMNDKKRHPYVPKALTYLQHPTIVGPSGYVKSVLSYIDSFCRHDKTPVRVGMVVSVRKLEDFSSYNCIRLAHCTINPNDSFEYQALILKHEIDHQKTQNKMNGLQILTTALKCDICFNSWTHHGPEDFDTVQNEETPRARSARKRCVILCKWKGKWYVRYAQDV